MTETATRVSLKENFELPAHTGLECLVVLYGGGIIGKKYDLSSGVTTIGRDPLATIVLDADSVSRSHARIEIADGQTTVVDLGSTNGTFVNDTQIERSQLKSGDHLKVGDVIFKFLAGQNVEAAYHEEIYKMTIRDGLTAIANVRYLNEFLEREFARSRRHGRELAVILFDIDHFKRINDTLGHLTGDYVLREMARIVDHRVRRDELFARYGGEEFCLVLPETTLEGATSFAEIIRKVIETHRFVFDGTTIPVTVSLGVAVFTPDMTRPLEIIRAADAALYRAKNGGRNRVET
ncbi:MAG TPA: GGDEF domain-containing protein [Myxococcota bacterium]|nr:GGDEF domain-containing protein [Myxococcota bacterium]